MGRVGCGRPRSCFVPRLQATAEVLEACRERASGTGIPLGCVERAGVATTAADHDPRPPRSAKGVIELAENPNCAISVSLPGIDLVVEETATRVTDDATLHRLADRYRAQGWEPTVKDGAFTAACSAPSAGPPPWDLYVITPTTAFGVATAEPHGATCWRFMV